LDHRTAIDYVASGPSAGAASRSPLQQRSSAKNPVPLALAAAPSGCRPATGNLPDLVISPNTCWPPMTNLSPVPRSQAVGKRPCRCLPSKQPSLACAFRSTGKPLAQQWLRAEGLEAPASSSMPAAKAGGGFTVSWHATAPPAGGLICPGRKDCPMLCISSTIEARPLAGSCRYWPGSHTCAAGENSAAVWQPDGVGNHLAISHSQWAMIEQESTLAAFPGNTLWCSCCRRQGSYELPAVIQNDSLRTCW